MKQPDRFDRMVEKVLKKNAVDMGDGVKITCPLLTENEAVKLLRAHHRRVVREVKRLDKKLYGNMSDDFQAGNHNAYMHILAALERMKGPRGS